MADSTEQPHSPAEADQVTAEEAAQVVVEPAGAEQGPQLAAAQPPAAATSAQPRIVFVETPAPPREKSNRLVGGVLALLGGLAFAAVYSIVVFFFYVLAPQGSLGLVGAAGTGIAYALFSASAFFWVPVLFFTLGFVVLTLILNRAGWWLYVLFSVVVAIFTYFASIGALLLIDRVLFMTATQAQAAYWGLAFDPRLVIAALVAREVSMWMGLAIAARGRRVRVRNAERRAVFERELAEKKAEHERAASAAS